jgi:hypothetical protein
MEVKQIFYDLSGKRRVTICGADDEGYSFIEEKFSDDPMELRWIPLTYRRSYPICASFEIAMREARGRIDWLAPAVDVK